jgi:hypothetical protein
MMRRTRTTRVEQPPIQPALRDPERHDFWPGFVCALIGLIILLAGARHLTGVETTDGDSAWETQLIKAFSSGGLEYASSSARRAQPPPDPIPGVFLPPEAPDEPSDAGPRWTLRVNLSAKTPCPT